MHLRRCSFLAALTITVACHPIVALPQSPIGTQAWQRHGIDDASADSDSTVSRAGDLRSAPPLHGLMWLSSDGPPSAGKWAPHVLSGADGKKHDLIGIMDLNGDRRPDVLTTEENSGEKSQGLGVIWYENPGSFSINPPLRSPPP